MKVQVEVDCTVKYLVFQWDQYFVTESWEGLNLINDQLVFLDAIASLACGNESSNFQGHSKSEVKMKDIGYISLLEKRSFLQFRLIDFKECTMGEHMDIWDLLIQCINFYSHNLIFPVVFLSLIVYN